MSYIESPRPTPFGAVTTGHATAVIGGVRSGHGRIVAAFRDWLARRRTITALDRLSDAQLADIGLTRAEIGPVGWRRRRAIPTGSARLPDICFDYPLI